MDALMEMKRLSFVVVACTVVAGVVAAQPMIATRAVPPDMERLTVLLDLNEYQKGEVERILSEQRQRVVGSFEEVTAQMQQAQSESRAKLQLVLTEQQLEKFDLLMEGTERRVLRRRVE